MKALLLYASTNETRVLSYNDDWKDAFLAFNEFHWHAYNIARFNGPSLYFKIKNSDLIVLLHSTNSNSTFVNPLLNSMLGCRKGKLVLFIGNEYKLIPQKLSLIRYLSPDIVASQLPQQTAEWLYEGTGSRILSVPHALNPKVFRPLTSHSDRTTDIGVRAAEYTLYLGDIERRSVHELFSKLSRKDLVLDISMNHKDRFERAAWALFLDSCRGTISTEAGSSFLERDDRTRIAVNAFTMANPMASFQEVYDIFFKNYENPVSGKCVSPRHFDAIGTKTCQILLEGNYNGLLAADEHYIPLRKDFSNLEETLDKFMDVPHRLTMVNRVYDYVMSGHTHRHRVERVIAEVFLRN